MKAGRVARTRERAGMTLVEVLLAAAIMGVGLTTLLTAASRCIAVMRAAKQYQNAQWALNLGELEHPLILPKDEGDKDAMPDWDVSPEPYGEGMIYEREVEEPEEDAEDGLFTVRSRVTWSEGGRSGSEEVVRLVFVKEKAKL